MKDKKEMMVELLKSLKSVMREDMNEDFSKELKSKKSPIKAEIYADSPEGLKEASEKLEDFADMSDEDGEFDSKKMLKAMLDKKFKDGGCKKYEDGGMEEYEDDMMEPSEEKPFELTPEILEQLKKMKELKVD